MQIHLYQTKHTIGDFDAIRQYLESKTSDLQRPGVHLFPELFLTGYPLQDLVLQKTFIESYLEIRNWLDGFAKQFNDSLILLGGLNYHFDDNGLPRDIENCAFAIQSGKVEKAYTKVLLPNYDIFDEEKYFSPGTSACVLTYQNQKIGVLICEDMWVSSLHPVDPVKLLGDSCSDLDLVVNLSASPFHLGKEEKRLKRGKEISKGLGAPFAYCNRVGGEDEILFDGGSFIVNGENELWRGNLFHIDQISLDVPSFNGQKEEGKADIENTWESLFSPALDSQKPPRLPEMTDELCQLTLQALAFGIQEYAAKCGFKKFLVALSGGIDSALVTAIVRLSLKEGQSMEAVYMPGFFSAEESYNWSLELCKNLGIPFKVQPIKFLHRTISNDFKQNFGEELQGLSDENIQSRLRGALIYARSNQTGAMVLNTSNKSEIAVGYSTQYGDSVGALSVLGDLYKSEVFALSKYINKAHGNLIPDGIITRPPSAELRENQEDSQSLPAYERLDAMLEGILSYRMGLKELQGSGFQREELEKVYGLYKKSEYKRSQFCPIIKVKAKSFGFGYRIPICKK
ncbi:MAG: NAD(+) synthase [Deltaproteobacteria bacterium]|nr:MAG: NAD(+) synthase [Deltaproteobacteria bacterium]TNF32126.1 MAG: NAD(+) synthase [Deltaproteobacteria bacterium]